MTKFSVILWTAAFEEQNGQAIVTRRVFEFQNVHWLECVYRKGGSVASAGIYLVTISKLFIYLILHWRAPIYAVASRSNIGLLRDLPVLAMSLLGRKVICHFHGSDALSLLSESQFSRLARLLYRNCILVVPSAHLLEPMAEMTGAEVILCENPAILDETILKLDGGVDASAYPILIWNSNMLASKGFVDVLVAVDEINITERNLDFWVLGRPLGDDEMSEDGVISLLHKFEGAPWFKLIGTVPAEDAVKLTSLSHIVALPSRYRSECQPLAVIQAMCLGKAIVASAIPAMKATLGDYPVFVADEPTVDSVKAAILDALSSVTLGCFDTEYILPFVENARLRFSAQNFDERMSEILCSDNCRAS